MAYIDIFDPRPIQLVRYHPATKKKLFPRKAPPWTVDKRALSNSQLRSCITFGRWVKENCTGKYGTVPLPDGRRIPMPAFIVMTKYPHKGMGVFGGPRTKEELLRRRRERRKGLEMLERIAAERGVAGVPTTATLAAGLRTVLR